MADPREEVEGIRFERLLAELTAEFINVRADEVDAKIEVVLAQIGEMLELDRLDFAQRGADDRGEAISHSWTAPGVEPLPRVDVDEHFPWLAARGRQGSVFIFRSLDDFPDDASKDRESAVRLGLRSGVIVPYFVRGEFLCAMACGLNRERESWPESVVNRLTLLGEVIFNALQRKASDLAIASAFAEIESLKDRLQQENVYLREEIESIHKHGEIVGESDAIREVLRKVEQVARTHATVLILGETGTGKELVARAIHRLSARKEHPMVSVNCAALPASLIESELFGREKGAFTSAVARQIGRFEIANNSTIFLDEVGDLPTELQVKLLRVLQEGQFQRLGSPRTIEVDVRVIAATNRNLIDAIDAGTFRDDLYYRLNVFPIHIAPLRERPEDIPLLVWSYVEEFADSMGKRVSRISRRSLEAMQRYPWPGNVRELRNVVERAMILSTGDTLVVELPQASRGRAQGFVTLQEHERQYIGRVLQQTKGRIRGDRGAAEILGMKPSTLYSRMQKLGVSKQSK